MSKTVTHIIHKLNLEVTMQDMQVAKKVQQDVRYFVNHAILPRLEALLKQLLLRNEHYRIDALIINLNVPHFDSTTNETNKLKK